MPLTAEDFRDELYRIMDEAVREGRKYVDVNAGEVHRGLGGYPGPEHRVPVCCKVMKEAVAQDYGDKVVFRRGKGCSLVSPETRQRTRPSTTLCYIES